MVFMVVMEALEAAAEVALMLALEVMGVLVEVAALVELVQRGGAA
jgi:hypothetical protein